MPCEYHTITAHCPKSVNPSNSPTSAYGEAEGAFMVTDDVQSRNQECSPRIASESVIGS